METKLYVLKNFINTGIINEDEDRIIREAAAIISAGGLCALPTETVYGLGGNALMKDAARRIYEAKGRPSDNPLIVHISCMDELYPLVSKVSDAALLLAEAFWPGPMTLIFDKSQLVPKETTGGLDTIAVRMPSHPVASRLIKYAGVPVAAPSANISGRPSTTSGSHCMEDLDGRVDAVVDAGSADIGLESTIIDLTGEKPMLLRPGAISREMIEKVLGVSVGLDAALKGPLAEGIAPKAPGMKYRHYAPKAPMILVTAASDEKTNEYNEADSNVNAVERSEPDRTVSECGGICPKISESSAVCSEVTEDYAPRTELERIVDKIAELIMDNRDRYERMALFCSSECIALLKKMDVPLEVIDIKVSGSREQKDGLKSIAHGLFDNLREFDADSADYIIAEGYSEKELGAAVMNRLKKAAAWHIIYV